MSTTLRINYLNTLTRLGRRSLISTSALGYRYRISLGDNFSENPFYKPSINIGEILATAAWVIDKQKPVIFDIGAHCGFIASQLAQLLKENNPAIYSFEPVAPTFSDLIQTIDELKLHEFIHPVPVALSNANGFVKLNYSKKNSMLAQIIPTEDASNHRAGDEVYVASAQTMDEFCETISYPDVIKIDVEGWEVYVFEGAKKMMEASKNIAVGLCLEWNPQAILQVGSSAKNLSVLLNDYRFFYLNDYEGQLHPELEEIVDVNQVSHVCNLFAIHGIHPGVDVWKKNFLRLKTSFGIESLSS